ncbi:hypothetical protein KI688_004487 [Linnemannia hyalina]|uniref:Uncharacterized protein n=1 Tax=Linnemannia hyalina TaxID=64524 RepID=A0A9P7XMG4_9FUNG|nr:hypothetical protein KI688_004487 [Linnemannia hyalina]
MHLIKLTILASLATVAFSHCVLNVNDCPAGTHAENEPEICRDMGYPPQYHLLCVGGDPAPLARVASRVGCVRSPDQCPSGTHAENEPEICRDMGYPPQYHLLCVYGVKARLGSLDRWLPRGSSRQSSLRESIVDFRKT